jgi:hypothetical protein
MRSADAMNTIDSMKRVNHCPEKSLLDLSQSAQSFREFFVRILEWRILTNR